MAESNDTADAQHGPGISIPVINKGDRFAEQKITLCYFDSGKLFSEAIFPMTFQYLAISHVWGQAKWQHIPGIQDQVLASDAKAKFLTDVLPGLVGENYFWMDILCVDQNDKAARIAITQYIPRIFKNAQRMIFVKDDDAIQGCCAEAMDFCSTEVDLGELLTIHRERSHQGQYIEERMLTRLWILEETIVSNTIQFVNGCPQEDSTNRSSISVAVEETAIQLTSTRFVLKLRELAKAWAGAYHPWKSTPKSAVEADSLSFICGYFKNGTVQRSGVNVRPLHPFPEVHTFYAHIYSTRRTSKPRDFILATMPQYSFYHVPANAKNMSFGDLFKDCAYQMWRAGFPMQPIISRQLMVKLSELAAPEYQFTYEVDDNAPFPDGRDDILRKFPLPEISHNGGPEPACLGDLVKLFCGPRIIWEFYPPLNAEITDLEKYAAFPPEDISESNPFSVILPPKNTWIKVDYPENWRVISPSFSTRVSIKQIQKVDTVVEIKISSQPELFSLLEETASSSRIVWPSSILGEFHDIIHLSDLTDAGVSQHLAAVVRLAAKFLHSWWLTQHSESSEFVSTLPSSNVDLNAPEGHNFIDSVVRLAALITCGLGSSAFEWSRQFLMPVLASVRGKRVMALVPGSLCRSNRMYEYWLFGAVMPGERWTLVAVDLMEKGVVTPCIFPWDVDLGM